MQRYDLQLLINTVATSRSQAWFFDFEFWVQPGPSEYNRNIIEIINYLVLIHYTVISLKSLMQLQSIFFLNFSCLASQKLGNENWCAQIYEFLQRILKLKIDYSLKPILQIQILAYLKNLFLTKKMRKIEYYKPLHWNLEEIDASLTNFVDRLILFCLSVVF